MDKARIVNDIEELKRLSSNGVECCILLNYGLKSSKFIEWDGEKFNIYNYIDDTSQLLTEDRLRTESNIAEAIENCALIVDA